MTRLLSTDEAAAELGVSRRRIQAMIAAGTLVAVRVGRAYALTEAAVDAVRERRPGRPRKQA